MAAVAEFDEKLNSILSNPDAMSQIMQLAQSLSGGQEQPSAPPSPPPPLRQEKPLFAADICMPQEHM